jgi:hypothetical protein
MAIFGNLAEWPFPEVMKTVAKRSGKLELWNLPSSWYLELYVSQGVVQALFANGRATDLFSARQHLQELLKSRQGEFELHPISTEALAQHHSFELSLAQILQMPAQDIDGLRDVLPEPTTRFGYCPKPLVISEHDLYEFERRAMVLLRNGTDAEALSKALWLPLETSCHYLYRLRMAGVIAPLRAADDAKPMSQAQPRPQGLIGRLISALGFRKQA